MPCLNPYYTGIHLHYEPKNGILSDKSLNPYYTGIHLHKKLAIKPIKFLMS